MYLKWEPTYPLAKRKLARMRPPAASGGLLADAANAGARCDAVALYEPYDLSGYPALHFEGDWLRAMLGTCVDVTLKPRRPCHFVIAQYL